MNFNNPLCASSYGNTGYGDCYLQLDKVKGAIQVPLDFEITLDDLATLQTFLEDKLFAPIGERIFPYKGFETVTDNTEEPTFNTTDYGYKYKVRDGYYDMTFRYFTGGPMLQNELQKNGGPGKAFLFYDEQNVLFGYRTGGVLKGVPDVIFEPLPWRFNTGADSTQLLLRFIFNPIYLNYGNLGYVKLQPGTFNFRDLTGLQEVELQLFSLASNIAKIQPLTKVAGVNLEETYATELAAAGRWRSYKRSDSSAITITSVVDDPTNKALTFTFNSGTVSGMDPTDAIMLVGQSADDWNTNGIEGFENSVPLAIELPGS